MSDTSEKKSAGWLVFLGILVVVFGTLAIGAPFITGLSVTLFVGAMITVAGVSRLIHAFSLKYKQGLIYSILLGIRMVYAGFGLAFFGTAIRSTGKTV